MAIRYVYAKFSNFLFSFFCFQGKRNLKIENKKKFVPNLFTTLYNKNLFFAHKILDISKIRKKIYYERYQNIGNDWLFLYHYDFFIKDK